MKSPSVEISRNEILEGLNKDPQTTILIIGGGIHGAALARIAALNSVKCVLFEKQDYASGTSSRSTKLAHGGLRYLETFDFQQVFEGIKAREELFESASHVCKPTQFLIPVKKNDWWFRLKLGIGLHLYDLMCKAKERKHKWIPRKDLRFEGFNSTREDLMGCYAYFDGIMNDARLVVESITHARELGAACINYMSVTQVTKTKDNKYLVEATDELTKNLYQLKADLVINCAGPWVPFVGHEETKKISSQLKYSAGIHLLFNRPWDQPALFLPLEGKARYYFVLPHPAGTMVGTTEREVTNLPFEQLPTKEEVNEILDRLQKDLPNAGLDRQSLHYSFAGVRTLPLRDNTRSQVATLSRKHIWKDVAGVLTLLGGKWTTSAWTAFEGFKLACKTLGLTTENLQSLNGVKFPGFASKAELVELESKLILNKVPPMTAKRIVGRLGALTKFILEKEDRLQLISNNLTKGEVELGILIEQAVTVEDLLRRRTELEYLPLNGSAELKSVEQMLLKLTGQSEATADALGYTNRIKTLKDIMN